MKRFLFAIVLVLTFCFPGFAAVHALSRSAKLVSYPARHPRKDAHAAKHLAKTLAKPVKFAAKQVF